MPNELTPQQKEALEEFAQAQMASEASLDRMLTKVASRIGVAKQIWVMLLAVGTGIVFTTVYIFNMQSNIQRNADENVRLRDQYDRERVATQLVIQQIWTEIKVDSERIQKLQLEMKDKAQRP